MLNLLFATRFLINKWAFPVFNQIWSVGFFLSFLILLMRRQLRVNAKILLLFSLTSLYLLFSLSFSPSRIIFWRQYYIFVFGFLSFIIGRSLDSQKIMRALVFSSFLVSLVSFYAFFIGKGYILSYLKESNINNPFAEYFLRQNRAFFPFLLPNTLGSFMSLAFILNLGVSYKEREKVWQVILGVVFMSLVILSRSLGALFCLSVVLSVYLLLTKRKAKVQFVFFLLAAFLVIFLIFILRQNSVVIATPSFSFWQRLHFWQRAFLLIARYPLTGCGAGGYYLYTGIMYCHNVFLQMWLDYGILGFAAFAATTAYLLRSSQRLILSKPHKQFFLSLFLANLFFLLHNLIDIDFYIFQLSFVWFVVAGIIAKEDS